MADTKGNDASVIRGFVTADSGEVSEVICRCLREVNVRDYGEAHIATMLPVFSAENLPRWFDGAEPYVLIVSGAIVGVGALRGADIQTVFVLPDCHGKGYGTQLMLFLERCLKERGVFEVALNSSLTSKSWYLTLGYQPESEISGAVGGDMIRMRKRL